MDSKQLKNIWIKNKQPITVVAAALVLTAALLIVRAGTPFASFEAESANLSGDVVVKNDASLSGGKYVEFVQIQEPPDDPPPEPSSDYGAGANGSSLPVPANAVSVNPSNIVAEINNRPGGTAFRLADGTYRMGQLPNKNGNKYYGNPNDHTKVVFDGGTTYSSKTQPNPSGSDSLATGGHNYVWKVRTDNVIANMTMQLYRGDQDDAGYGAMDGRGTAASNVLVQNIEFRHNQFSGFAFGGKNWTAKFITSRHNGQYGLSGSGFEHLIENSLIYANGLEGLPHVPRYHRSDRGGFKFVHMRDQTIRNTEVHSHNDNGMWWDGTVSGMLVENNYIHDNRRHGIIFELALGGTVRNNLLVNNATGTQQQDYRDAGIFSNIGGRMVIEDNIIDGARNGIILYQPGGRDNEWGVVSNPICGSIIRNNTVKGNIRNAWIGIHSPATYLDCNPENNPSQVTIQNNTEQGSNIKYWFGELYTPSQWSSKGYN